MKTLAEQQAWEAHDRELPERLLRFIRTREADASYAESPAPLSGGHWARLYRFRLTGRSEELVLRVLPTSDEQCAREAAVQAAAAATGFPAPRVFFTGGRKAVGFPFIVMEHVAGAPLGAGVLWRLPEILAQTLAQLHGLDVKVALAQRLDDVLIDLDDRSAPLAADFSAGLDWLRGARPAPGPAVLCHGDFHPLNVLVHEGRVTGVLDWAHALVAEPEYDVAYTALTLALWPLDKRLLPRRLLKPTVGRAAAAQFVAAYRRRRALDEARLAWFEALHAYRILVRVARARSGITLPPLGPRHPWELVVPDAAALFARASGIRVGLPARCEPRAAS